MISRRVGSRRTFFSWKLSVVAATICLLAGTIPIPLAQADPLLPRTVPLGDVPSAQIWVLGEGPITTPGLEEAMLFVDAETSLVGPQFVLQTGPEVTTCDPEFEGVVALYASGSVEATIRVAAFISGTRTDTGEPVRIGASREEALVGTTDMLPGDQVLEVCVSPLPVVHPEPEPEPTPTPIPTPTPTPTPDEDPPRSLDLSADKQEVAPNDGVVFSGRLTGASRCLAEQPLMLEARRPDEGSFRPFRGGRTDQSGYFRLPVVVGDASAFRAFVPATEGCESASSAIVELTRKTA